MTTSHRFRFRGAAFLLLALLAAPVLAADGGGGLVGWVENTHGVPIAGALVSIFGKGIRGGTLITLSDSHGQFMLPSLPAGSYTLRALDSGHLPSPPRRVTVVPDRDSLYTVNLTPVGETPRGDQEAADSGAVDARETRWLMRHKRRSVLEERDESPEEAEPDPATAALLEGTVSAAPELAGRVELVASAATFGAEGAAPRVDGIPASLGIVRLNGRLSDTGSWSAGALISENENTFWRMAAALALEPGTGNQLQVGTGYSSSGYLQPTSGADSPGRTQGSGAIFVQDRWQVSPRLVAVVGARYSYVGFLENQNYLDPQASIEYRRRRTVFRGTMAARTLVPGGDLLALSAASSAPALGVARIEAGLRAERLIHYEVAVDRALGATTLGARAFQEDVQDQLVNLFEDPSLARSLRILNAGPTTTRGMGVTFSGHLGEVMNGSVSYTYGRSWRDDPAAAEAMFGPAGPLSYREADFHDVIARVETFFDGTDTRLVAFYRLNSLEPEAEAGVQSAFSNTKRMCFDIQVSQGLPFLQSATRADWELLLAVRNLFYDASEAGVLDEVAVVHPPKRVLGGISVRF